MACSWLRTAHIRAAADVTDDLSRRPTNAKQRSTEATPCGTCGGLAILYLLLCSTAPAGGQSSSAQKRSRATDTAEKQFIDHVKRALETEIQRPGKPTLQIVESGEIAGTGRADVRSLTVRLESRVQYRLIAACDQDCSHVELVLLDGQNAVLAKSAQTSPVAVIDKSLPNTGDYRLELRVPGCREKTCHAGLIVLRSESSGAPVAARAGEGGATVQANGAAARTKTRDVVSAAQVSSTDPLADCNSNEPAKKAAGCTALIATGSLAMADLAIVYSPAPTRSSHAETMTHSLRIGQRLWSLIRAHRQPNKD